MKNKNAKLEKTKENIGKWFFLSSKVFFCAFDVLFDLGLKLGGGGEFLFFAEEVEEMNADFLTVKVTVEVEEEGSSFDE